MWLPPAMWFVLVVVFLSIGISSAQSSSDASRKNLQRMRSSIESTRKRIDALQRRESSTMRSLSTVQRQREEVSRVVRSLESDLRALQDSVSTLVQAIRSTSTARQRSESAYNELAFAAVVHDAEHPNHAFTEPSDAFLLEDVTAQLQRHRKRLRSRQDSLSSEQQILNSTSSDQERLLRERAAEGRQLTNTISSRKKELDRIRGDKSLLLKELAAKRASANTLSSMIRRQAEASRLAEARRQKEEAAKRRAQSSRSRERSSGAPERSSGGVVRGPAPGAGGSGFSANSLPWPTQSHALIHGYGVYRNRETGTTLDNPGIDIRSPIGARMTSVAAGVVTSVTWLPGFGSLVIVDHKNGFRTVYANLTSVSVGVGTSVNAGTVIGSSGESIDGPTAHFEVWRGRDRQNPLTYLR